MSKGIVLFATDDESIIKDVQEKIEISKNESKMIKETSKSIIEHLFNLIEKNININEAFEYEFEKGFYEIFCNDISYEIEEVYANSLLDKIISNITDYNKNFEIEKEITLPDNFKIKINKNLFDSFLKYIFNFAINSSDSYKMKINGAINYVVNKEIFNFIINIADKTNEKMPVNSEMNKLTFERIEFINTFMNQLMENSNGKFRINRIDTRLMIEMHLMKTIKK